VIWEWAGVCGIDPRPLSLRQLHWAVDGAQKDRWNHTAELLALTANAHRNPEERKQPYTSDEFHPYRRSPGKAVRGTAITGSLIRERAARWRAEQAAKIRVETSPS